ncbi:KAP family NTPase [Aliarcobacter cryaerophilus]|uniref:KAP family NTPase n=1 Tax=Aliarcobacter cryaerophilus TaxID=28198 RepID=UPI0021B547F2|nr:KAP family NTPase [Aliarcobacter cryaerophilus]MCT7492525.1 KAP family NTPase [Aliarcobacter cryaerophilus]
MTQQKLEEKLYDLLIKSNEPFVASISGEWGIGKTYFLQKIFLEKYKSELSKKQIAYVSLFGHNSLNDIKTDIVLQISKTTKYISKFKDKIKSIKGAVFKDEDVTLSLDGGSISAVLSLLTQSDFKDVIICFDDFERLSSKIELKDIMGLISNLKEQKSCQVLLIMNEKELDKLGSIDGKKYSAIYKLYKEKIIDYDFVYSVDILNDFDVIYKDLQNKELIKDFFKQYEISNIRVGKQIIRLLKEFNSIVTSTTLHENVKRDFVFTALSCFVFKVKFGLDYQGYSEVREYYLNREINDNFSDRQDKKQTKDTLKEEQIKYIYKFGNDTYESIVWSYIDHESYDKKYLTELLANDSEKIEYLEQKNTILNAWHRLHSDFSFTRENFIDIVKPFLISDDIHKVLNLSDFHFFVDFIKKYENIDSIIIDNTIKKYIDDIILREKSISIHESHNFEILENYYPHLVKYRDDRKHELLVETTQEGLIAKTLEKSLRGWAEKDQYILNNVEVKKYKEIILTNPDFVLDVVDFIKKSEEDKYFGQAVKNIKKALEELSSQSDDYKFKVERILKEK